MKSAEVTLVRIYITEGQHQFEKLMKFLHDEEKVQGVTAFRGIAGFGQSGRIHSSSLIDISLDLPLVLEFFDTPDKVARVLTDLKPLVKPGHVIHWTAHINMGE